MKEVWKEIPDFNGWYDASNLGRIRTYRTKSRGNKRRLIPKVINCYKNPLGYIYAKLKKGKNRKGFLVHRLIAKTFVQNPNNKPHINHIDGNPSNNHVDNLEWCTPLENTRHAHRIGLVDYSKQQGENGNNAKLKRNEVLQIRSIYEQGWASSNELGKAYNISGRQILRIVNNKRWSHI